jgi:polyhydroxybutyrate depolymerase
MRRCLPLLVLLAVATAGCGSVESESQDGGPETTFTDDTGTTTPPGVETEAPPEPPPGEESTTTAGASTTSQASTTTSGPPATTESPDSDRQVVPVDPGEHRMTIVVEGEPRSYLLLIPASYDGGEPVPLVMAYHGACHTPEDVVRGAQRWGDLAEEHGFILVAPLGLDGVFFGSACEEWAVLHDEQELARFQGSEEYQPDRVYEYFLEEIAEFSTGSRDVEFTSALLDALPATLNIDPGRVFVTGFSLGGWMASRVACDLGERVRGVAPTFHSLLISRPCPTAHAVAVASIGDRDGYQTLALQALADWAAHHGCDPDPTRIPADDGFIRLAYAGCADGTRIEMYHSESATLTGEEARIAWDFMASLP